MGVFRPLLRNFPFLYFFIFLASIPLDRHRNKRGIYHLTCFEDISFFS